MDSKIDIVLALTLSHSTFYVVPATLTKFGHRAGNVNFDRPNE